MLILQQKLAEVGLEHRADKSHALVPASVEASSLQHLAQIHADALPVLGSEAGLHTAVALADEEASASAAKQRLATGLSKRARQKGQSSARQSNSSRISPCRHLHM